MQDAEILSHHVGLRPFRSSIRLETEHIDGVGGVGEFIVPLMIVQIPVVHNYGHGGGGVTLSWGSAVVAVEMLERVLSKAKAHM